MIDFFVANWGLIGTILWGLCELLNKTTLKSNTAIDLATNIIKRVFGK